MTPITDKLAEAIELAEDAMAYVPEYFTNKHGMNRRMAALKEEFAALASQQADQYPDAGKMVAEPSDARVEAAAKALHDELGIVSTPWEELRAAQADAAREIARAVLQAADAVSAGAGWMPIETAPEGELVVVGWQDEAGTHHEFDYREDGCWMHWHDHAEHVEVIGGHGVRYTPPYTHWVRIQPLPAAPGSEQKEGANG